MSHNIQRHGRTSLFMRGWAKVAFGLPFFAACATMTVASSVAAQQNQYVGRLCDLGGCTYMVPTRGGDAVYTMSQKSDGDFDLFAATGSPALSIAKAIQAEAEARAAAFVKPLPPPKARVLELRDPSGFLFGGISEIPGLNGVLIVSRHALQARKQSANHQTIERAFEHAGLASKDFAFFSLSHGSKLLDLIVIIPKNAIPSFQSRDGMTLESLEQLSHEPQIQDSWSSWQIGSVGTDDVKQYSHGLVSRVGLNRFWLDLGDQNHSSPGSSGSLVWVSSAPQNSAWSLGGIVECIVPRKTTANGLDTNGAVRVIPMGVIALARLEPVDPKKLASEPMMVDGQCIPVDRRGGGGW